MANYLVDGLDSSFKTPKISDISDLVIDTYITQNSPNPVSGGAIYNAVRTIPLVIAVDINTSYQPTSTPTTNSQTGYNAMANNQPVVLRCKMASGNSTVYFDFYAARGMYAANQYTVYFERIISGYRYLYSLTGTSLTLSRTKTAEIVEAGSVQSGTLQAIYKIYADNTFEVSGVQAINVPETSWTEVNIFGGSGGTSIVKIDVSALPASILGGEIWTQTAQLELIGTVEDAQLYTMWITGVYYDSVENCILANLLSAQRNGTQKLGVVVFEMKGKLT